MRNWQRVVCALVLSLGATAWASKGWETDFDKASGLAKSEGKFMLVDFSGSDWCGWCIKLDKEVFSQSAFKDYARENLVTVLIDFPRESRQKKKEIKRNEELKNKYEIKGFPTVLILSPEGELAGRTGYKAGGPDAYIEHLKKIIEEYKAKQK
ncbi:MAG: thioredoxin family protein [Kiritimatiellia bacterium]|nr:thioredoxin family protein [Kiritimatiellia bacterium]